jgi:hypothetical protein
MNTFTLTLPASPCCFDNKTGQFGPRKIKRTPHRHYDVDTFDNLSTCRHGPARKRNRRLLGNLADWMDSVSHHFQSLAYNKRHAADGKVDFT